MTIIPEAQFKLPPPTAISARIVRAGILSTALFVLIYATTPPQHWGEVTQALLYHQVRTTDPTFCGDWG